MPIGTGTSRGFRIYHTDPDFRPAFQSDEDNVAIIEMMFSTSLVALVLSPRRLVIRNTKVGELVHLALAAYAMCGYNANIQAEVLNHL